LAARASHVHVLQKSKQHVPIINWRQLFRYPFVAWQCWRAGNINSGYGDAVTAVLVVLVAALHFFNGMSCKSAGHCFCVLILNALAGQHFLAEAVTNCVPRRFPIVFL
jgi:hypothetical protein